MDTYTLLHPMDAVCHGLIRSAGRSAKISELSSPLGAWGVWHGVVLVARMLKRVGEVELEIIIFFVKANRPSRVLVITFRVLSDIASNGWVYVGVGARLLTNGWNEMSLSDQLLPDSVQMLHNGRSRRSRVEAVGNGVPWQIDFVPGAFEMQVQEKLFSHTGTLELLNGKLSRVL